MSRNTTTSIPLVLMIAGAGLLGGGFYLQSSGAAVSAADKLRCEQNIRSIYQDNNDAQQTLLAQCNDVGFVAMMDARANNASAAASAQAIASANQSELGSTALGYGIMGMGIALLISGLTGLLRKRSK